MQKVISAKSREQDFLMIGYDPACFWPNPEHQIELKIGYSGEFLRFADSEEDSPNQKKKQVADFERSFRFELGYL